MKRRFTGFYVSEAAIPNDKFRQAELQVQGILRPMKMEGKGHQRREGRRFAMMGGIDRTDKGKVLPYPPHVKHDSLTSDVLEYVKNQLDLAFPVAGERMWLVGNTGMRVTVLGHRYTQNNKSHQVKVDLLISVDPQTIDTSVSVAELGRMKKKLARRFDLMIISLADNLERFFEEAFGHYKATGSFRYGEAKTYVENLVSTDQDLIKSLRNRIRMESVFGFRVEAQDRAKIDEVFPSYEHEFETALNIAHDLDENITKIAAEIRAKQSASKGAKTEQAVKKLLGN